MRVDLSSALNQIEQTEALWTTVSSSLPAPDNLQNTGVSVTEVTRAFHEVYGLLRSLENVEVDGVTASQMMAGINSSSTAIANFFRSYGSNPAQVSANIPSVCSWLYSLKTQLVQLIPAKKYSPRVEREMTEKLATVESWATRVEELKVAIEQLEMAAKGSFSAIETTQRSADTTSADIQEVLAKIQAFERAAATAKTSAESAAASAITDSSDVEESAKNLAAAVSEKEELFAEFDERREEINGLLQNANKVGLAKSFQDKRIELTKIWRIWALLFFGGIAVLILIGYFQLLPLLKENELDPISLGVRFMLTGPIIWFTWFAARQYAHVLRVSEDYAFKEAAAMAFVGYRNEVAADADMLKLLQEYAIKNFGNNPAELLLKKGDSTSPLHELIDKVLEKVKPEDIIKLLKSKE